MDVHTRSRHRSVDNIRHSRRPHLEDRQRQPDRDDKDRMNLKSPRIAKYHRDLEEDKTPEVYRDVIRIASLYTFNFKFSN